MLLKMARFYFPLWLSQLYSWGQSFGHKIGLELFSSTDVSFSVEGRPMCYGSAGHLMGITWCLPMPWTTLAPPPKSLNGRAGRPTWTSLGTEKPWLSWWVYSVSDWLTVGLALSSIFRAWVVPCSLRLGHACDWGGGLWDSAHVTFLFHFKYLCFSV